MKTSFFCDCNKPYHQLILTVHPREKSWDDAAFIDVLINPKMSFWNRLKFLFNPVADTYAELVLTKENTNNLIKDLQTYNERKQ